MAILGLRGTGNLQTNERPESWRQGVIRWYPNGHVPLQALVGMQDSEPVSDYKFNWWDRNLPEMRVFVDAATGYAASTANTAVVIDDGAGSNIWQILKAGTVVKNERTGEQMIVAADPTTSSVTFQRQRGTTAAAAGNDNDALQIVGTAYEDGASASTSVAYDPTQRTNVTQIFNDTLTLTRRAMKVQTRTEDPYLKAKRELLLQHMIKLEWSAFLGEYLDEAGSTSAVRRTLSGGMYYWVTTNVHDAGGTLTYFELMDFLADDFRYGSNEKLLLAGSQALLAINKLAKLEMVLNAVPGEQSFGMNVTELIHPAGALIIKQHPLLSEHALYRQWAFLVDLEYFKLRYLDDTTFVEHVESPGSHRRQDEYYSDLGWELQIEKAHAIWQGVTGAA